MRHDPNLYLLIGLITTLITYSANISGQNNSNDHFVKKREKMVTTQLKSRGINDQRVLNAMQSVERHLFVPNNIQDYAYQDRPLPIGYEQTISQPYIVAYMTEALKLQQTDKVLEIGTGSGYQAAILAEICDSVFSIEIIDSLGLQALNLLTSLGYKNINVKIGDGYKGWPEYAPFNSIIVTCAPTHIPKPLEDQLAEGGKLIIPYGERTVQKLVLFKKINGKLIQQSDLAVRFVPMLNSKGKKY